MKRCDGLPTAAEHPAVACRGSVDTCPAESAAVKAAVAAEVLLVLKDKLHLPRVVLMRPILLSVFATHSLLMSNGIGDTPMVMRGSMNDKARIARLSSCQIRPPKQIHAPRSEHVLPNCGFKLLYSN